ncbi:MAG: tRNA (guanosine(46)-N7)-methyltransferase TrmB [Phycisphaerales bacterium]|nr:tRNA (guanosine(46)-N7)-methyltransferase TrmB [Phycisphaerales bacterium]
MSKKKQQRFVAITNFKNVIEYNSQNLVSWNEHFKNNNPITLELACGKGEYTIALAKMYPERNFIGIDIKGDRIWKGASIALQENLHNIAFVRTQIEHIQSFFKPQSINEIWITFPDPQIRYSKAKKRLTYPRFLKLYAEVLQPSGVLHLKTDSEHLYEFTKIVLDLHECRVLMDIAYHQNDQPLLNRELSIQTHYERLNLSRSGKIFYLQWQLPVTLPSGKEPLLKTILYEKEFMGR